MSVIENMRRRNEPANPPMPRVANVPPARVYDDDVLAQLQRWKDLQVESDRLRSEMEDWRRQALDAQREVKRLEMCIERDAETYSQAMAKLTADRDCKVEQLTEQRDVYRDKITRFATKFGVQGKGVIDLAASVGNFVRESLTDLQAEGDAAPDRAGKVGLAAIADEISGDPEFREVDEMPRVVRAGPTDGE